MLLAWDPTTHALTPVPALPESGWVHASKPVAAEVEALHAAGISRHFLAHALDRDEVPRIDKDDSGALVVMRVPRKGVPGEDVPFRTTSLGVILHERLLVTVSRDEVDVPAELAARKVVDPAHPNRFALHLVEVAAELFLKHLRTIEHEVDQLEGELQASLRNREVLELLRHQKALVHFTTGLAANELMLGRLQKDERFAISPKDHELLEDAQVEIRQAIESTRIAEEILSQMMDAFASIISNNLNVVMKVLTALTVVLTFPTMVASFYGMNVELPLQRHPAAFILTLAVSVAVSVLVAAYFWRKRWL